MNYLLDTCVLSEFTKRQPKPEVVQWLAQADEQTLFLSVLSVGEIQRGIERLTESRRKDELRQWLDQALLPRFVHRLLPLDAEIMLLWGALTARLETQGRKMSAFDSLIAATALFHHLTLVTRNETDFADSGVNLVNPWNA
ncbi:MAG: ribonuclease VapC [Anaerolineae bacterium]|nr:MAG: ribonuclease VapC [Anaerolineae bacterium]